MPCEEARLHVQMMMDDELTISQYDAVLQHLADCDSCRHYREELSSVAYWLTEIGNTDRHVPVARAPRRSQFPRLVRLAAAAAVLFLAGFWILQSLPEGATKRPTPTVSPIETRVAHLIPENEETTLVRPIKSQSPDVHIVWLYPTVNVATVNNNGENP